MALKKEIPEMHFKVTKRLSLDTLEKGKIHRKWLHLMTDALGGSVAIPVLIAKGVKDGPVLGITATIHGDELNGIPVIQKVFEDLDPLKLQGIIIGIPVVNTFGFMREERHFMDGKDLNTIMPGSPTGEVSKIYVYRLLKKVIKHFTHLVDLHTARQGHRNAHYIRVDMTNPSARELALLFPTDLILHNIPNTTNLRGSATKMGITALTLELGDPLKYQKNIISETIIGMRNILYHLKMLKGEIISSKKTPIVCSSSYRLRTKIGGVAEIKKTLLAKVQEEEAIGFVKNIFGDPIYSIVVPEKGVIIGRMSNPIKHVGDCLLHIGKVAKKDEF